MSVFLHDPRQLRIPQVYSFCYVSFVHFNFVVHLAQRQLCSCAHTGVGNRHKWLYMYHSRYPGNRIPLTVVLPHRITYF